MCDRFLNWSRVICLISSSFSSGSSPFWEPPDDAGTSSFEERPHWMQTSSAVDDVLAWTAQGDSCHTFPMLWRLLAHQASLHFFEMFCVLWCFRSFLRAYMFIHFFLFWFSWSDLHFKSSTSSEHHLQSFRHHLLDLLEHEPPCPCFQSKHIHQALSKKSNFRQYRQMEKPRWKESERRREDQRGERMRRKKMQVRENVGKQRFTVFLPMICGSGGPNVLQSLHKVLPSTTLHYKACTCTSP